MNLPECIYFAPDESPSALASKLNNLTIQIATALDGRLGMENMSDSAYGDGLEFQNYRSSPGNPVKQRLINTLANSSGGGYIAPKKDLAGDTQGMDVFVNTSSTEYGMFGVGDSNDPDLQQIGDLIPEAYTNTNPGFQVKASLGKLRLNTGGDFDTIIQRNSTDKYFFSDIAGDPILKFGGEDLSYPAIKRSGGLLQVRYADDSDPTAITANSFVVQNLNTDSYSNILDEQGITFNHDKTIVWKVTADDDPSTTLARSSDGVLYLYDALGINLKPAFQLGGTDSGYPMIQRDGQGLKIRLADDGGYTTLTAGTITSSDGTNDRILMDPGNDYFALAVGVPINWSSGSNAGGSQDVGLVRTAAGAVKLFSPSGITSAFKLQFGGATSSEPMLKRNGTILEARLGDDSALTGMSCDQNFATMQVKRDLLELAPALAVGELYYATNANMLLIGLV